MTKPRPPSELLAIVGAQLARLSHRVVFVGGATTHIYITDPAAPSVRSTIDVDVIVDVTSYIDYVGSLRDALLELGAREDTSEGAPLCRWILAGIPVDVMAPDECVLGFSNRWYSSALEHSRPHVLPDGTQILVTTGPHFLATKVEAFRGRGQGDFLGSKDMEDIITVFDGRAELVEEIAQVDPELRGFLQIALAEWAKDPDFENAVCGHLPGGLDEGRDEVVMERIYAVARLLDHPSVPEGR